MSSKEHASHKGGTENRFVLECVFAAAVQRIGEGFGDRGGSEEREGLYYPEKRSGREGWKQASLTAARWPRSTATGSGGGRRRGRSRPAISSRAVAPVQSDGAFASQFENENVQGRLGHGSTSRSLAKWC